MGTLLAESAATVAPVDFRRPSRIGRDAVVALETTHDTFARRIATAWSSGSYAAIEVEHVATDQLSIDDFARSLPQPTLLACVKVDVLDATAFLQVDLPFALIFVERLLGGIGDAAAGQVVRRPTDLEQALMAEELIGPGIVAIDESLREIGQGRSELQSLETMPQPLQLGSPGDLLLLLTYHVEIRGDLPGQGLVTLAYPVAPLIGHLDLLVTGVRDDGSGIDTASPAVEAVLEAPVDLRVRLGASPLPAAVVAGLQPGDVLRLDHPVAQPADLVLEDHWVGTAHLGRRGRRVAIQIDQPPTYPRA